MSKNVLVISASPRKAGNSDLLCDEFIKGALSSLNKTEKIFLRDKKIGYCVACDYCKNHSGKCFQNDDMAEILQKMIDSDVIVLATPVYFYTMDAQLKTLIDRTVARYLEISNKEFYFIVTAADSDVQSLDLTIEGLRGFTDMCLHNPIEKDILYGAGVWEKGDVKSTTLLEQAFKMGKNI